MEWLISLASGAVGGNLGGALLKKLSLGPIINSVLGMLGGAGGMQLLAKLNLLGEGGLLSQIGGGAVGGTALMAVVGLLKKMFGGGGAAPKQ